MEMEEKLVRSTGGVPMRDVEAWAGVWRRWDFRAGRQTGDLLVTYLCIALFCKGLEAAYTYNKIYHGTNTTTTKLCPWGLHRSEQEEKMAREERPKVLSCLLELPMAKY